MTDDTNIPAGTVPITNERGQTKLYETVPARLKRFREAHPDWSIVTKILEINDDLVRVRCRIYQDRGDKAVLIATGHAEEWRHTSDINRTNALENCETSALGRALANAGFGSADSIATAEEVISAKQKKQAVADVSPGVKVMLQNAARDGGMKALEVAWNTLAHEERVAMKDDLPKLKKVAAKVDQEAAQQRKEYERGSNG